MYYAETDAVKADIPFFIYETTHTRSKYFSNLRGPQKTFIYHEKFIIYHLKEF